MDVLAIIPARGGSKGIPLKNVVPVCGHPLLAWSIRQAQSAKRVQRVLVSTDCDEIAAVADDEGCAVFWRSPATATDTATTEAAVLEVLQAQDELPDATLLLQCTSPLRQPHDIDEAIALYEETGADSVFGARRVEGYVWQHTVATGLVPLPSRRMRRQERQDTVWEENGSLYVFRTELFLREHTRHCGRSVVYPMDAFDSFQIDEPEDIGRLEALMPLRLEHVGRTANAYPN